MAGAEQRAAGQGDRGAGDQHREQQAADHGDRDRGGRPERDHRVGDGLQRQDRGGDAEAGDDDAEDAEADEAAFASRSGVAGCCVLT